MSEAEATTKPVEATQPVEAAAETTTTTAQSTEEKPVEKAEATEESAEKSDVKIIKTQARTDYKDHQNNRKFDPSSREVTDDPAAIRKQVRTCQTIRDTRLLAWS